MEWMRFAANSQFEKNPIWLPVVRYDEITMFKLEIWWIVIKFVDIYAKKEVCINFSDMYE